MMLLMLYFFASDANSLDEACDKIANAIMELEQKTDQATKLNIGGKSTKDQYFTENM